MSFQDNTGNRFNTRQNNFTESGYQSGVGIQTGGNNNASYGTSYNTIYTNIQTFSSNISNLTKLIYKVGSASDSAQLRQNIEDLIGNTMNLAKDIKVNLEKMNRSVPREKKAEMHKLTSDFQTWFTKFQDDAKSYLSKKQTPIPTKQQEPSKQDFNSYPVENFPSSSPQQDQFQLRKQELIEVDNERDFHEQIIRERHEGIKEIETKVVELNEMFRDLAVMVDEQGIEIDNIESNLANAEQHTNQGVVELVEAEKSQRKARNKLCCIALIAVIAVAVAIFVVLILTKFI